MNLKCSISPRMAFGSLFSNSDLIQPVKFGQIQYKNTTHTQITNAKDLEEKLTYSNVLFPKKMYLHTCTQ